MNIGFDSGALSVYILGLVTIIFVLWVVFDDIKWSLRIRKLEKLVGEKL